MEYLVTAQEMKAYDRAAMDRIGIPSMVLMERAALSALDQIKKRFGPQGAGINVLILAGTGNNGGDGLALARLLSEAGFAAEVLVCGDQHRATPEWTQQRAILENYPVRVGSKPAREEYTILIDALFGVGLSREVEGDRAEWIEYFNSRSGFKLALDIPSGVGADDGRILGCAVNADLTVTFGFAKRGLYLYPGRGCAGEIATADIGISGLCFGGSAPGMFRLTEKPGKLFPPRRPDGNKGSFGKALLCAGSRCMAGAAVLAAESLYRTGVGMVKVITPKENRIILQSTVPEALLGEPKQLEESLNWADTVVIGPGLGKGPEAARLLAGVLNCHIPTVIDADGLNLLAEDEELQGLLSRQAQAGRTFILTPHMGELARLAQKSIAEVKAAPEKALRALSERFHCVIAGKDAVTLVCAEGRPLCLCTEGNSGMATAGSGDVLSGVIGGLLAQGLEGFEAACRGVYIHAAAGAAAAETLGEHGVMAGDIVRALTGAALNGGKA